MCLQIKVTLHINNNKSNLIMASLLILVIQCNITQLRFCAQEHRLKDYAKPDISPLSEQNLVQRKRLQIKENGIYFKLT